MNYTEAEHVRFITRVFEEHGDYIRKVIYFKIKNESLVDDFFQECFLSLIQKPIPCQNIKDIKSYLFKVIHNDIIDAARRIQRYQTSLSHYLEEIKKAPQKEYPETALIQNEESDKILSWLKKHLSAREAQAIILRYRENCTNREMAQKMGVKASSVNRYICIGLKKARLALNEIGV
ncbi:MAG: putative RNA polymerase sigma factor FecI [Planctomycetes bacterium ADurb.Bin412]|nr:MAG: putative RNA polymerase sigma factor FecI [Planctomycetes bacterium ADurb.Bin412]